MTVDYLIEKFTRCPECDSYTLSRKTGSREGKKGMGHPDGIAVYCTSCNNEYILTGNTLKKKGEPSGDPVSEVKEPSHRLKFAGARKIKWRYPAIAIIIIVVIAFYLLISSKNQKRDTGSTTPAMTSNTSVSQFHPPPESKTTGAVDNDDENSAESKLPVKNDPVQPGKEPVSNPDQPVGNSRVYKVFENSYIKVRSSHREDSAPTYQWFYKKTTVILQRSSQQKVFIAGGPSGNTYWAVDDEIRINNHRIRGCRENMEHTGIVPGEKKLPPYDITDIIPPDRVVTLNIRLVDYGILWGNTPIYFVVK